MIQAEYGVVRSEKRTAAEIKVATECPINFNEEVKKIISVNAVAFITSAENKGEKTLVRAKVAFRAVYLTEDGFKKCEAFAEAEAELPIGGAIVCAEAVDVRMSSVNDGFAARCGVRFTGESFKTDENQVLTGGEGLIIKPCEVIADEVTETASEEFTVADEFEVNYAVKEVLCHSEFIRVKSVESGVSRVIFEGDAEITVKALPFSENNDIIKEKRAVPFRFELPVIGALPDMLALGEVRLSKEAVKVFTDEAKNKSSISVDLTLAATGCGVNRVKTQAAIDAYSRTDEVMLTRNQPAIEIFEGTRYRDERITAKTNAAAPDGARILGTLGEAVTVFSVNSSDGKTTINGSVKADVIFRNADNGTTCVQAETPFSLDIIEEGKVCNVKVALCDLTARVRGGDIEFEFTLAVRYDLYAVKTIACVAGAESLGERKAADSAITVFIPAAGDELWDVSKRLACTEDEVTRLNPDLEFPLKGDERIIIYRQKI